MTGVEGADGAGGAGVRSRRVGALVAAVVVVVLAVGVVLLFGIRPYPDLPTLRDRPDPPVTAQLAYIDYGTRGGPCLHVVDGVGVDRTVGCSSAYGGDIVWLDDGRLGVRSWADGDGSTVDVIDVDSGTVVETGREDRNADLPQGLVSEHVDGDRLRSGGADGRVWVDVLRDGASPERVLELDGPAGYALYDVGWSGDGRWVIAVDSAQRVLVVGASGEDEPRIWTRDAGHITVR